MEQKYFWDNEFPLNQFLLIQHPDEIYHLLYRIVYLIKVQTPLKQKIFFDYFSYFKMSNTPCKLNTKMLLRNFDISNTKIKCCDVGF
ncbi:unnamed protein product [Paramecium octaurelia]|uniref:Uncharacterized protein n=1 Tax=Paramecium octaurelia TaxID=43137 RepID=A0A8S1WQK1_PAROT|nr:unnamed protein product [Paramecium octaurelia]